MCEILVIRDFDKFSRILSENGHKVINLPLIETKTLSDLNEFDAILKKIENYDGIFITSQVSAKILATQLKKNKIAFRGKVYVFGRQIYEILKKENLDIFFNESANTAKEMLENIDADTLKNKQVLFVRGKQSLGVIPEVLADLSKVDETIVYETREISVETDKIREICEKLEKGEITATCFFSPSAGTSFIKQFGKEILHQTIITTIGKTTAEFFERENLKVAFTSSKANAENYAIELVEYLKGRDLTTTFQK